MYILDVGDSVAKIETVNSRSYILLGVIVEKTESNRHVSGVSNKRYYTIEWASEDNREEMVSEYIIQQYKAIYEKMDYYLEQIK